jgi:cysteine synthase A
MRIRDALSDKVGSTPLVRIDALMPGLRAEIFGKLECFNPTGSVKDRAALFMIYDAEQTGRLKPGCTIIEATSGNMGIALASLGAQRGYRVIIVMPDSVSPDKIRHIRAYGAEVVFTPAVFGMKRAFAEARRLAVQMPGSFMPDQSKNPANPAAHRATTGKEIWEDTDGHLDVFVAGVGTGGTLSGVADFLHDQNPKIEIVAVEPQGSPVLSRGVAGSHRIEGIGPGFVPDVLRRDLINRIETVSDAEAGLTVRLLARKLGIFAGPSSGAAVHAALRLAREDRYVGKVIVTLLPDSGERYADLEIGADREATKILATVDLRLGDDEPSPALAASVEGESGC